MPFASVPEFIVNNASGERQDTSDVSALPGGNYLVTWRSHDGTLEFDYDIHGKVIDSAGNTVVGDFRISDPSAEQQSYTSATPLAGGKTLVTWFTHEDGTAGAFYNIMARVVGQNGALIGGQFKVNTTEIDGEWLPNATTLSNGNAVIAWETGPSTANSNTIYARIIGPGGKPIAKDFKVNTTNGQVEKFVTLTPLNGGQFLATWQSGETTSFDIRARIFDSNGKAIAKDFVIANSQNSEVLPVATKLVNGNVLVAWQADSDPSAGLNYDIHAKIINAKGATIIPEFIVNSGTDDAQTEPEVLSLKDGRFMVLWSHKEGGQVDVKARVFGKYGFARSDDIAIVTDANDQGQVKATVLANGKIALSFVSSDGIQLDVKSKILDPLHFDGTSGAERYVGGDLNDTIFGNDGADYLGGRKGNDYIDAGADNDTVIGHKGNDVLIGGAGADDLTGGLGNDKYKYFAPTEGGDTIHGFAAGDTFVFDSSQFGFATGGALPTAAFFVGPAAHDANDRFIYTKSTGQLWFDSDGNGANSAVLIATLDNHYALTAADIKLGLLIV